jgi:hypothetical protein
MIPERGRLEAVIRHVIDILVLVVALDPLAPPE